MIEAILELVLSAAGDLLIELLLEFGYESIRDAGRARPRANPYLAALGLALLGAGVGCVTVVVLPRRIIPAGPVPGIGLFLSPVATGLAMQAYGGWATARGREPSFLATFWGGAAFALSAGVARRLLLAQYGQS